MVQHDIKKRSTSQGKILLSIIFLVIMLLSWSQMNAQFANVPVTGYNADIVADGATGAGTNSTTADVDGGGFVFVSTTFNPGSGICASGATALPVSNTISSLTNVGLSYTLQSYTANNALRLTSGSSGQLTFVTPTTAANLYLLGLGGSGACTITATVKFTDSTSQVIGGSAADWCSGTGAATTIFYRIARTATTCTGATCQFLYDVNLPISGANYSKPIAYITISSTGGILSVMGVGMRAVCTAPADQPTLPSFSGVSTGSIGGSFTAAASTPTGYLVVRYPAGSAETAPVNGVAYSTAQSLGLGTVVQSSAATSFTALGLTGSTNYDFYVYSYNSGVSCGGPVYLTSGGFIGSQSTNACGVTISGTIPVGAGLPNTPAGGYTSITNALADINAQGLAGATILELDASYTTAYAASNETYPITFQNNPCISSTNNLTIRPVAGTATPIVFTTNNTTSTFNFNGGSNIIIDGRPGGIGTTSMLTVANTNLGATPSIQFINDASSNIVRYVTIQSVNNSATSGTLFFGSTTGVSGNDNNTIDNCTISDGATTPVNAIYSAGLSAAIDNSGNNITNCNISNYYNATTSSAGILLSATGNNAWTISNNRLFQTSTRLYTSSLALLSAITISGGSGYTITGNTIGFANASGTGTTNMIGNSVILTGTFPTAYNTTGTANATRYIGINCAFTAGGSVSNIQGNTVAGIALYTSSGASTTYGILCGIQVTSGNANIGTVTGNTIGATSGNSSLYAAATTGGGAVVGIYATSTNTVSIQNNNIGAIDAVGTTTTLSGAFTGIDVAGAGGIFDISNNNIGNSTVNNIRVGYTVTTTTLSNSGTLTSTTGTTSPMVGIRHTATGATVNISGNTIKGIQNGTTAGGALTGITSTGSVTSSATINNNFLGTATQNWVNYQFANTNATTSLSINISGAGGATTHSIQNNAIRGIAFNSTSTMPFTFLTLTGATAANDVSTIANNTFTAINLSTTGAVTFINHGYLIAATGTLNISNNNIVTSFTKTGASGAVTLAVSNASSASGAVFNFTGNNFSNISVTGAATIAGINNTDGGSVNKNISGNTLSNWTGGTGTITALTCSFGGASGGDGNIVSNNTISNISSGGAITGIILGPNGTTHTARGNTINTLSSTGASAVNGITSSGGTTLNIQKNKIYDLSGSNASSIVNGINVSAGTTVNISNNIVGDLRTPAANAANPLVGINLGGGTTINATYNTVRINGNSSGALFGSSALSASTSPNITLRNNILINQSTFTGAGIVAAYRRSTTTTSTHNVASNKNIYYAGNPGLNNLVYFDGTNSEQTVLGLRSRLAPAELASGSEAVTFLSTTGSAANFLHIDGTVASYTESGADIISTITDDFDGHLRFGSVGFPGGTAGFPTGGTSSDIGADEYDGIAQGALNAPYDFNSNTPTTTSFNITWADSSIGEAGFIVSRSLNPGGPFVTVATITSTSSASIGTPYSLAQTGLLGNTTYYYQIVASNVTSSAPLSGSASTSACGSGYAGTITIPSANFPGIKVALDSLILYGLSGPTILELDSSYTGAGEVYPLTFTNTIGCLNATNTLTVRPSSNVVTPLTITSANALATVDINGANFLTIDGRAGGTGTAKMLNIINTNITGVAVRFINDASNNTLTYCDVQALNSTAVPTITTAAGVIFFNSAGVANTLGNDNNTISFCNIHSTGIVPANFTALGIASFGTTSTTASYNDNNIITNNNIYDFFHATLASTGIKLDAGNTAWTISDNHIYQTQSLNYTASTATHRAIWVTPNTGSISNAANGFIITGNFIGGNAANGSGAYTTTGTGVYNFKGMDLSVGLGTATSVQNNTLTNWNFTGGFSGNNVYGIDVVNGNVNVGTITGNVVGSASANSTITVTTTVTNGSMIGLRSGAGGTINFSNNTVGGIDMTGNATTVATGFSGIAASGGTNLIITNNIIGNATLANSINMTATSATSTTAAAVRGIIVNGGTTSTITGNLIANINTNYSGAGSQAAQLIGITVSAGSSTTSNNTIRNLSTSSQTIGSAASATLIGLSVSSGGAPQIVSGNTIHTLRLAGTTTSAAVQGTGMYYNGPSSGIANVVEKNNIHSISLTAANNNAIINGLEIGTINTATFKNNMIRLGVDDNGTAITTGATIRGIVKTTTLATNLWHNSVYVGGSGVGISTSNSFAFNRTATGNDSLINNIFVNNRSNATTGGKHYAISVNTTTTVNANYNIYYGNGTGYVFGFNGTTDLTAYSPNWVAGDLNSYAANPSYLNPEGSATTGDLHINPAIETAVEGTGLAIATVTDDFDSQLRSSFTPTDIGADAGNFTPLTPCSGAPDSVQVAFTSAASVCASGSKTIILSNFTVQPGYTYQWQESATGVPGSFVDVTTGTGGTTLSYTTATLTSSMYFHCVVTCTNGGSFTISDSILFVVNPLPILTVTPTTGTNVCSGSNVNLSATGANTYVWSCNPVFPIVLTGTAIYPQVSMFSTPNNLATVTSRPTSTLATNVSTPPATTAANTWSYTVVGTSAAGCTASANVVLNVITTATVPLQLTYTSTPTPLCAPGTPVTLTVTNPGTIGTGTWTYNWYNQAITTLLQTDTSILSTNSFIPDTPTVNGNYIYTVKVSNSLCPASYAIASPSFFVGYTSLIVPTDANCGDNGTVAIYPEGQNNFSTWYTNNFNTGLNGPAFDALFGNAVISGGRCNITTQTNSQNGTLLVRNPATINSNNLQVDFKLSTAPRGMAFNILGADGIAWSYAPDVFQGQLTPATGGFQAEGGSGTGFKLAFDATANGSQNTPGAYLMFNCTTPDQGPSSPGVLAFKQGSFWQGLVDAPVSIIISQNGFVTVTINNEIIFDHVALPTAYLTANKSSWLHAFTARTGGSNELHAIDDLNIRYNSYEYSTSSTSGLDGDWQTSNIFSNLGPGFYPVWVRNPSDTTCFTNTGNAFINVGIAPSSAITIPAPDYSNVVCFGNSTVLTTDISIPGAAILWESADSLTGTWSPAAGDNDTTTYTTANLTNNQYFRMTFTCPGGSPVTSTPLLVSVNKGTVASTNSPQNINCVGGSATVTATPGPNSTIVWYAAASGGSPIGAGNNLVVTPSTLPTTYYAEPASTVFSNHYSNGGQTVIANTFGTATTGVGITTRFTTTASVLIDSIKVIPSATGTLSVSIQNAGSVTNIGSVNFTVTTAMVGNYTNVPVNLSVPGSGNYQITTAGVACSYYSSYSGTYTAPYMTMGGGVLVITGSATTTTGASSTGVYGTAFRWAISSTCAPGLGARVPVLVQTNPATAVTVAPASSVICSGSSKMLSASSPAAYNTFTWTPIANLFLDSAGTLPYNTGDNTDTVYYVGSTAINTTITCTATDTILPCTNTGTTRIIVQPSAVTITATPANICTSGTTTLGLSPGSPYGDNTIEWLSSPDSTLFTTIPGADTTIYITDTLTATTYYQVLIKDENNNTCTSASRTIIVSSPTITATFDSIRCGQGTINLNATATVGDVIRWYDNITGGAVLFTGNTYSPNVTATDSFYVDAFNTITGCFSSPRQKVNAVVTTAPAFEVSSSNYSIVCGGDSVTLSVITGLLDYDNFTWTPATGLSSTSGTTVNAAPSATTTYSVVATSSTGDLCRSTDTVLVTVAPRPVINSITASSDSICIGDTIQLTVNATPYILPTFAGAYTLTPLSGLTYSQLNGGGITVINDATQLLTGMGTANQDDGGVIVTLPFNFTYNSVATNEISFCTNGWISASNQSTITATNMRIAGNLFTGTTPNNTMAPWFKDMGANFGAGFPGSMRHGLIGTDIYAFQWDNAVGSSFSNTTANLISFQINIYGPASGSPGRIDYIYGPTAGTIAFAAAVGVENATGGTNNYINALNGLSNSTSTSTAWPGDGNGYRFTPLPPSTLSYSWTNGSSLSADTIANPLAFPTDSTTYNLTVVETGTGCSASSSITIDVDAVPQPYVTPGNGTICASPDYWVYLADSGAYSGGYPSGTLVNWLGIQNGLSPNDSLNATLGGTNFIAEVTTANGCTATSDTVTINVDVINVNRVTTDATCGNPTGQIVATVSNPFGVGPYRYVWTDGVITLRDVTSANNTDSLENLVAGTYFLTVYDNYGGVVPSLPSCNSGSLSTTVNNANGPDAEIVSSVNITCFGLTNGEATADATGGVQPYSFLWSTTETTPGIINLGAGLYVVTVTDANGCTDTAQVTIVEPSAIEISVNVTNVAVCGDSTGSATAIATGGTPGYLYEYYDENLTSLGAPSTNPTFTGLYADTFFVQVTDTNNCTNFIQFAVTEVCDVTVNLKVYFEGYASSFGAPLLPMSPGLFLQGVSASDAIADTIQVDLRDPFSSATVIETAYALIDTGGNATLTYSSAVNGGTYWLSVIHRSSVETFSGSPITLSGSNSYNFTTSDTMSYGPNMKDVFTDGTTWAMYSGDIFSFDTFAEGQDGFIDIFDLLLLDFDLQSGVSGYYRTDLNGDGFVDIFDLLILDPNIQAGISKITPP